MVFGVNHEAEAQVTFLEDVTISSASGVAITPYNRNRNSLNAASLTVYSSATITGGTQIGIHWQGAGKKAGGGVRETDEFILKRNTDYSLKLLDKSAGNNVFEWDLNWYEEKFN
jgi:hypothetical protein